MLNSAPTNHNTAAIEAEGLTKHFGEFTAVDALDLHVETGTVVSLLSHIATPFFVWVSLVRWTLPDGSEAFGEDQDTWSPGKLRSFLTAYRAGAAAGPAGVDR